MDWIGKRDLAQHCQHLEIHASFDYFWRRVLGYQLKKTEMMLELERVAVNTQGRLPHLVRFVLNVLSAENSDVQV
jgi:hypothetical protein